MSKHKLRYKGSLVKDEVHIDMMRSDFEQAKKLMKYGYIPPTLPSGILRVKFHVYKKKLSWIQMGASNKIEFTYDIWGDPKHVLTFTCPYGFPMRGNRVYNIHVPFDCTTKKDIIKYFIDCLL